MNLWRNALAACAVLGALAGPLPLQAADAPKQERAEKKEEPKDIVLKGDAVCTSCHDEVDGPELLAIGKIMTEEWIQKAGADGKAIVDAYRK